ncbi:DUF882 domain-containing protein [Cereibacter sphaeroides]|uniref:YcbK family protein n=1 Tax=Cereibacter sphaeroides TaxID=1063 RepID=UPI001F2251D4|nr:DUF882 domain-containing protein [Cereibacter sphaeroides]MCE6959642.1 DUF882 domain-containing protein [Cereibacter sphaeroides]MCE6974497.1 DUF882 domain-containing protein [Cereibacter sphaeroides]
MTLLTRRTFLSSLAGACATAVIPSYGLATAKRPGSRLDRLVPLIDPVVDLHNPHTGDTLTTRFHGPTGYDPDAVALINYLMRDWREASIVQMDVRLFWALAVIRQAAMKDGHSGLIHLNSGYRTKKTNDHLRSLGYHTAPSSMHIKAQANDIVVEGAKVADIAKFVEWLQVGGTGHYRGSFVHMDSGPIRQWSE